MIFACSTIAAPVITGTAYPGNTLTSTIAGQWYVNGGAVSGETGSTYVIRLNDIGYTINQTGSNTLTCWSPAVISSVAGFWTPYRNVFTSVGPEVAATNGQTVTRWTDIKAGIQLNHSSTAPVYDTAGTYPFLNFSTDLMLFNDLTIFKNKQYGEILWSGKVTSVSTSSSVCTIVGFKTNSASYWRIVMSARYLSSTGLRGQTNPVDTSTVKTTASDGTVVGTNYVIGVRSDWQTGGQIKVARDNATGLTANNDASGNTPNTNSENACIGGSVGLGTSYVNGEYRCICLVNGSITATERSQLARYMGLFVGKNISLV